MHADSAFTQVDEEVRQPVAVDVDESRHAVRVAQRHLAHDSRQAVDVHAERVAGDELGHAVAVEIDELALAGLLSMVTLALAVKPPAEPA